MEYAVVDYRVHRLAISFLFVQDEVFHTSLCASFLDTANRLFGRNAGEIGVIAET